MFVPRQTPVPYPLIGFGYEEVGEVIEVAPEVIDRHPGQLVWGIWGHRAEAVLAADAVRALPAGLDPLAAVFARPGAIALTAVLAGDLHLGDWVGVFGQGVIGLLATRLAVLSGARVVAVDTVPDRLEHATRYGARSTVDATVTSAAAVLRQVTGGRGADVRRVVRRVPGAARGDPLHRPRRPGRGRRLLPGPGRRARPRRGVPPQPHPVGGRPGLRAHPRAEHGRPVDRRPGRAAPSWTWWPTAASTRCRWSATSSTPARSPTPSRCSTAAPVTSSKSC